MYLVSGLWVISCFSPSKCMESCEDVCVSLVHWSLTDLYDSSTEARLLRQLLQRLCVWVVVLSKLGLHHLHVHREEKSVQYQKSSFVVLWGFKRVSAETLLL